MRVDFEDGMTAISNRSSPTYSDVVLQAHLLSYPAAQSSLGTF
jgi:hypothetical protein